MSIIAKALAPCSKCGEKSEITIYKSINISGNPELKEKLRDGSLFIWECPHCHQANLARYETLYHDPEKKIMIWLMPSGDLSETQMQAIANHTRAMGGYRLRLVKDVGALMEKLLIFDAGLDDMAVEMCKYVTKMEMMSGNRGMQEQLASAPIHFHRTEDNDGMKSLVFIYPAAGQMMSFRIGFNVYEDSLGIIARNPDIVPPQDTFTRIDQDWILSFMK